MEAEFEYEVDFRFSVLVTAELGRDESGCLVVRNPEFWTPKKFHRIPLLGKVLRKSETLWSQFEKEAEKALEQLELSKEQDFDGGCVYRFGGSWTGASYLGRAA